MEDGVERRKIGTTRSIALTLPGPNVGFLNTRPSTTQPGRPKVLKYRNRIRDGPICAAAMSAVIERFE